MKPSNVLLPIAGLATILAPQAASAQAVSPQTNDNRPNIVLILVDDMGYSDIGCFGSEISTPNIDRLANEGIRMTQFYNAARSCPSRAALLTGMYHHKTGIGAMTNNFGLPAYQGFLNQQCLTLAEGLKTGGYSTYMSGKWHVGDPRECWPYNRGFDKSFAYIGGATPYFKIERKSDKDEDVKLVIDGNHYDPPKDKFYTTDAFSQFAVDYIQGHKEKNPFFLYVSYTAPHWPLQAYPEDIAKYKGVYDKGWDKMREERYERMVGMGLIGKECQLSPRDETVPAWDSLTDKEKEYWSQIMAIYAAMMDRVDQGVGNILSALEKKKILDNTLVIFVSDNGGCMEKAGKFADLSQFTGPMGSAESFLAYEANWANVSNTPFRYFKHWMHEGGISAPFVARYPKMIKAGSQSSQPAHFIDIMPTFLDLANIKYPTTYKDNTPKPLDGVSIIPILKGYDKPVHDVLYFEHLGFRAVRQGKWKIVSTFPENTWELYDLSVDRTEQNNLSNQYPEIVTQMDGLYQAWTNRSEVSDFKDIIALRRKNKK